MNLQLGPQVTQLTECHSSRKWTFFRPTKAFELASLNYSDSADVRRYKSRDPSEPNRELEAQIRYAQAFGSTVRVFGAL